MAIWPFWWSWDLEFTDHAEFSMMHRGVTETDVRLMLEEADDLTPDKEPGRWIAHTRWERQPWHVVVEPVFALKHLAVITAYRFEPL